MAVSVCVCVCVESECMSERERDLITSSFVVYLIWTHRNTLREKMIAGTEHARLRGENIPQPIIVMMDRNR